MEQFLGKCIESVCAQNYRNLEIILVDDGSTDNSGEICDAFAKKDDRIQVIHKRNAGVSAARNSGMAIVSLSKFSYLSIRAIKRSASFSCFS